MFNDSLDVFNFLELYILGFVEQFVELMTANSLYKLDVRLFERSPRK